MSGRCQRDDGVTEGEDTGAFQTGHAATPASDIVMLDAAELALAITSRRVSCVEVMTAFLDHIDAFNPKVNAIVALREREGLIAQARVRDDQLARGEMIGRWFNSASNSRIVTSPGEATSLQTRQPVVRRGA